MKKVLTACLLGLLALSLSTICSAKDKKLKYGKSDQVVYLGEVTKKVPAGKGTLTVQSMDGGCADLIHGTFVCSSLEKGTVEGEILFSSGYVFKGTLAYELTPTHVSYTLQEGVLTADDGRKGVLDGKESLHFQRKYLWRSFEMTLKNDVIRLDTRLKDSPLFVKEDWDDLSALCSLAHKRLDTPERYIILSSPYTLAFPAATIWTTTRHASSQALVLTPTGEDDFEHLEVIFDGSTTYRFTLKEGDVAEAYYMRTVRKYSRHFGKNVVTIDPNATSGAYNYWNIPGYYTLPSKFQRLITQNNFVTINGEDGSSYSGSVRSRNGREYTNRDRDFQAYLLFGMNDLRDLTLDTGEKSTPGLAKTFFIDTKTYEEWMAENEEGIEAENARIAEERAQAEAQRLAEEERKEAEERARREAEEAAVRAQRQKEEAAYQAECKKYGKRYVDRARNYQVEIGMPEELFLKYFSKKRTERQGLALATITLEQVYRSARRTEYRLNVHVQAIFDTESADADMYINFENGKLVSYENY